MSGRRQTNAKQPKKVVTQTTVVSRAQATAPRQRTRNIQSQQPRAAPAVRAVSTLSATMRFEKGREALGSINGINGFASYAIAAHPASFPLRLNSIAQQYALYRIVSMKVRLASYLAANDRGEFAIGFDFSASTTIGTDYKSNSDITAIGGIRMQAGEATKTFVVDCSRFTKRAFPYTPAVTAAPGPGDIPATYVFDSIPGHIIIGVSGTPVNGQQVADVEVEYVFELDHPVKVPSQHAGGALAPVFAQTIIDGKMLTYTAAGDPSRKQPVTSSTHSAYTESGSVAKVEETKTTDLNSMYGNPSAKGKAVSNDQDASKTEGQSAL